MEYGVQSLLDTAYFNIVKFLKEIYTLNILYIEYTFFLLQPMQV